MKLSEYSKLATEQNNPRSRGIDRLSVDQMVALIQKEDRRIPLAVARSRKQIVKAVSLIVKRLKGGGRLFFAGAGTSGRLGILEAAECPPTFNTRPSLVRAVMAGGKKAVFRSQEGAEDRQDEAFRIFQKNLKKNDAVVGVAASGVTPFVAGAFRAAKKIGAAKILVTCAEAKKIGRAADCVISVPVGPEIITGSTRLKAGTATKLVLNTLTVASMVQMGKVYQNWMVDLQPRSRKLRARALSLIQSLGGVSPVQAETYLEKARGRVKTAILMARKKLDYPKATRKLREHAGFLGQALAS